MKPEITEGHQVFRGYKYELDPNNKQKTIFLKHAGCARFAYNWGLEQRIKRFQEKEGLGRLTTAMEQHRALVRLKQSRFTWMYEVSKCAPQEALRDLEQAFKYFWQRRKAGIKSGFPRFKKKGTNERFRLYGRIKVFEKEVQLPRIGKVRLKEQPNIEGQIISVTISRKANRWFISFRVKQKRLLPPPVDGPTIGVDLGLRNLATLSDSKVFKNPRPLSQRLRKLRRLSKIISRRKRGSKNWWKAIIQLATLHWRIRNIKQDALHKLTTYLAKNHRRIVIENLKVTGMLRNRALARAISEVGFYEFRRQLEYKTRWNGSELIIAPLFHPSSKICSQCGAIKQKFPSNIQIYQCTKCGLKIDRDLNAAQNLVAASWAETQNACGADIRPKLFGQTAMNQEPNTTNSSEYAG